MRRLILTGLLIGTAPLAIARAMEPRGDLLAQAGHFGPRELPQHHDVLAQADSGDAEPADAPVNEAAEPVLDEPIANPEDAAEAAPEIPEVDVPQVQDPGTPEE